MDPPAGESSQKRSCDTDKNERNKRRKIETPEEMDRTMKMTEIIDDCLVQIFERSKLQDLINLADTCKQFQPLVKLAYETKCREKMFDLDPRCCSNRSESITLFRKNIRISDLSNCLKVLRHFGNKIPKLYIDYFYLNENGKAALARYMNKYCSDSLTEIAIHGATQQTVSKNWTKPFANVVSIELCTTDVGNLNTWFPNMRSLVLRDDLQCIGDAFPRLEELKLIPFGYEMNEERIEEM